MALRVVAIFAFLTTLLFLITTSIGTAGGPPNQPTCAPMPQPCCAPPACGQMGPSPCRICGALLGACTNICGAVIGVPSAIMAGLLAPAPRRPLFRSNFCAPPCPPPCAPPVCGPPMCAPPACVPTGITKCKPPRQTYMRYGAVSNPSLPYPMTMAMPATAQRDLIEDLPGGLKILATVMQMPLNLVSGSLIPNQSGDYGPVAASSDGETLTGQYW
ncbi:MAG: hypothetical protein ACP5VS_16790 [Desulfomonilaceae bacterium]